MAQSAQVLNGILAQIEYNPLRTVRHVFSAIEPTACLLLATSGRPVHRNLCLLHSQHRTFGSGTARHEILAINATNVRFLPIPSALPSGADTPGVIVDSRL